MFDVMIIDDEIDVREYLSSIIDWDSLPIRLAAQASDMDDARELFSLHHPKIIITDINLTMGSGLDLVEEFLKADPALQCIIITGYSEFSYAQRALNIGVVEFLLKPIFPEAINSSLSKAVERFQAMRRQEISIPILKRLLEENRPSIRDAYLGHLLRQTNVHDPADQIMDKFNQLQIECPGPYYAVVLMSLSREQDSTNYESSCLLMEHQANAMLEAIGVHKYLFFDSHFRLTCIISADVENIDLELLDVLTKLKDHLDFFDQLVMYAGISCVVSSPALLNIAFQQAKSALNFQNVLSDNSVIHYKDVRSYEPIQITGHVVANELRQLFLQKDFMSFENLMIQHMESIVTEENSLTPLRSFVLEVLAALSSECSRQHISISKIMASQEMVKLLSAQSADEIRSNALYVVSQMMNEQEFHYSSNSNHLIRLAKEYIAQNLLDKNLSLDSVSESIGLSRSYFCDLFHKTESVTFSNYLKNIRIAKAKQLLSATNLRIYEIADAVGFSNVKYFCYVFKKSVGCTPSEYQTDSENKDQ